MARTKEVQSYRQAARLWYSAVKLPDYRRLQRLVESLVDEQAIEKGK